MKRTVPIFVLLITLFMTNAMTAESPVDEAKVDKDWEKLNEILTREVEKDNQKNGNNLSAVRIGGFTYVGPVKKEENIYTSSDKVDFDFPDGQTESFSPKTGTVRAFYGIYEAGRLEINKGNYAEALKIFNQALPFSRLSPEKAMTHRQISTIYRLLSDCKSEQAHLREAIKYSQNEKAKEFYRERESELKKCN